MNCKAFFKISACYLEKNLGIYHFQYLQFCSILLLYSEFNRCPYQLLRPYKRHEENKSKIEQEQSYM